MLLSFKLVVIGANYHKEISRKFLQFSNQNYVIINKEDSKSLDLFERINECFSFEIENYLENGKIPCDNQLINLKSKSYGYHKLKVFILETTSYYIIFKNCKPSTNLSSKWESIRPKNSKGEELEYFDISHYI